jgi:hypothetical protein
VILPELSEGLDQAFGQSSLAYSASLVHASHRHNSRNAEFFGGEAHNSVRVHISRRSDPNPVGSSDPSTQFGRIDDHDR